MAAQQNTSWGFLLRVAETTPAAEGRAPTGVAPWVADTGYFHWTPGHEAHGLACGPSESSAAGASSEDRTTGRSRFWACTALLLVGAVLLAATICMAASSNWMLLASAVRDVGTGTGVATTTTGQSAGTRRAGGLMFHRHGKVDGHDRRVTDRGRPRPPSATDVSSGSPGPYRQEEAAPRKVQQRLEAHQRDRPMRAAPSTTRTARLCWTSTGPRVRRACPAVPITWPCATAARTGLPASKSATGPADSCKGPPGTPASSSHSSQPARGRT